MKRQDARNGSRGGAEARRGGGIVLATKNTKETKGGKKWGWIWVGVVAAWLSVAAGARAEGEVSATATLAPQSIRVGEPARLEVRVAHPAGTRAELPEIADDPRLLVIGTAAPVVNTAADGSLETVFAFDVTSLTVTNENLVADGKTIRVVDAEGNETEQAFPFANLEVVTSLAEGQTELNPPLTELRKWPLPWGEWLLRAAGVLAAGVLMALAIAWAVVAWTRRRKLAPAVPPVPPDVAALNALAALRARLDGGALPEPEPFFVELSGVVRHYLEGRFGLRAPESTTEEFLHADATRTTLSKEHRNLLAEFLEQSDLVKFARYEPSGSVFRDALDSAERLVRETMPVVVAHA